MTIPLVKKLGIKEGISLIVFNSPNPYASNVMDIPETAVITIPEKGLKFDFVHMFSMTYKELERDFHYCKSFLKTSGIYRISWSKMSSEVESDLSRDIIRTYVLSEGLVGIKICSLNETWSGLKFVYRIKNR